LTDNIFTDTSKTFMFRQVLGLTISEVSSYKNNDKTAFESGSRTRLLEIQKQLSLKSITTSLTQRPFTDKTKI